MATLRGGRLYAGMQLDVLGIFRRRVNAEGFHLSSAAVEVKSFPRPATRRRFPDVVRRKLHRAWVHGALRKYSILKSGAHVAPLSADFSQI